MMKINGVGSFNKFSCCLHACSLRVPLYLSDGLGGGVGGGEKERSFVVGGAGWWSGSLPRAGVDSAFTATTPKHRHHLATDIFGHEVGLAVLACSSSSRYYFLRVVRIFYFLSAATKWLVPGVGRDGCARRRIIGGEALGSDRVSAVASRVLCLIVHDQGVIFSSFVIHVVNLYPLHVCRIWVLRFTLKKT